MANSYAHFNWVRFVIDDQNLPFHAKGLALYLYTFMNGHQDIAWPSLGRIGGDLQLSRNTVIKYTRELEQKGYIEVVQRPNKSNVYKATLPGNPFEKLSTRGSGGEPPPVHDVNPRGSGGEPGGSRREPPGVHDVNPNSTGNSTKNITKNPESVDNSPVDNSRVRTLRSYLSQLENFPMRGECELAEIERVKGEILELENGSGKTEQLAL